MRTLHHHIVGALAAGLLITSAATLRADDASVAKADVHFRHAVELYREGDYAAALVEFQRAYELEPAYQVLYNIASAQDQLQDYARALRTFERYLREGGDKIPAARRADVQKELEKLKRRVATITITTKEPGALITIDDVQIGKTPLREPLLVSAGRRKITASLPGRPVSVEIIEVAGGDERAVTIEIREAPEAVKIVKVEVPVEVPALVRPSPAPFAVSWTVTTALLAAGAATGGLALGASSDLEAALAAYPGDRSAIVSARDKAQRLALASDVLFAASAVMAGVSLYLTIKWARTPPTRAPKQESAGLLLGPSWVGFKGTF